MKNAEPRLAVIIVSKGQSVGAGLGRLIGRPHGHASSPPLHEPLEIQQVDQVMNSSHPGRLENEDSLLSLAPESNQACFMSLLICVSNIHMHAIIENSEYRGQA